MSSKSITTDECQYPSECPDFIDLEAQNATSIVSPSLPRGNKYGGIGVVRGIFTKKLYVLLSVSFTIALVFGFIVLGLEYYHDPSSQNFTEKNAAIIAATNKKLLGQVSHWPLYAHMKPEDFESIQRNKIWVNMNKITLQKTPQDACLYGESVYKITQFHHDASNVQEVNNAYEFMDSPIPSQNINLVPDACVLLIAMNRNKYEQSRRQGTLAFSRDFHALPFNTEINTACDKLSADAQPTGNTILIRIEDFPLSNAQITVEDTDGTPQYIIRASDSYTGYTYQVPFSKTGQFCGCSSNSNARKCSSL